MVNGITIKFGDFYVSKSADGSVISVGDESVDFVIKFGQNLIMFKSIDMLVEDEEHFDEETEMTMTGMIESWFNDVNIPWDGEFMDKKNKLIKEYLLRVKERMKDVTPDDVKAIMN